MARNRIVLVTEFFAPPYDEGIKKTAYNVYRVISERYDVKVVCRDYDGISDVTKVNSNPIFLSISMVKAIRSHRPLAVIYLPFASFTLGGYIRNIILGLMALGSRYGYIGLQPKPVKLGLVRLLRGFTRGVGLTPSIKLFNTWKTLQWPSRLIPLLTDLQRFGAISDDRDRESLRAKYGIKPDGYVISHVGHLSSGRNLESLIPLQRAGHQVLIISSTSTPNDSKAPDSLKEELTRHGIVIYEGYIEDIAEVYHISDLYIFPVQDDCSSIGLPLSILEARACGVPVLTTQYGSVYHFLQDDFGGLFYARPESFEEAVARIRAREYKPTKSNVTGLNDIFCNDLFHIIEHDTL